MSKHGSNYNEAHMTPDTKERLIEEMAEQLHNWYLEATDDPDARYNPEAVVPYGDLPEGSKIISRHIAAKVLARIVEREAAAREEVKDNLLGLIVKNSSGFDTIGTKRTWHVDIDALADDLAALTPEDYPANPPQA